MAHAVDQGRSWLVLAGAFVASGVTVGNALTLGTLFDYVETQLHGTAGTTSFLFALTVSLNFFVGAFAGPLTGLIGYRTTIACGAALSTTGFALSIFATHVWHLYFTLGLLVGLGFGLAYTPSVGILGYYFDRYFHFAGTVSSTGTAVGVIVYSKLHPVLLEQLGWSSAMLIEAALCTLLFGSAFVIKEPLPELEIPLEELLAKSRDDEEKKKMCVSLERRQSEVVSPNKEPVPHFLDFPNNDDFRTRCDSIGDRAIAQRRTSVTRNVPREAVLTTTISPAAASHVNQTLLDNNDVVRSPVVTSRVLQSLKAGFRSDLFSEVEFYLLMIAGLAVLGCDMFVVMTPKYLVDTHGWSTSLTTVSLVLIVYGGASLVTRLGINVLNVYPRLSDRLSKPLQVGFGIVGILAASLAYFFTFDGVDAELLESGSNVTLNGTGISDADDSHYAGWLPAERHALVFFTFAAVCGVGEAFFACYQASLLKDLLGNERLTASFGYLNCAWGIGTIACYPLAGIMADYFNTMRYAYAIMAFMCAVSGVALVAVMVVTARRNVKMRKFLR